MSRTPAERWGTCCPFDPECDHSFLDVDELAHWMHTPITDEHAAHIESDDFSAVVESPQP